MPSTELPPAPARATERATAYAAVDLGASSGRVMLGLVEGGEVRMTEVHRFANGPHPDSLVAGEGLRWDVDRLFAETLTGLAAAVRAAAAVGRELSGIGVDSWGVDYAILPDGGADGLHEPGLPIVLHHRGADPAGPAAAGAHVSAEQAYALTGVPPHPINSSSRLHADAEAGGAAGGGGTVLLVPDLWVLLLSGEVGAERTIASTTQLLDARTGEWSSELLDAWGLGALEFPRPVDPGTPAGLTLPRITARIGAAQPVPVYRVAEHDTASALAFAVPDAGELIVSSGSWSLAGLSLSTPVLSDDARLAGLTNERGIGGSTLLLRNLAGLWLLVECTRHWSAASGRVLDLVDLVQRAAARDDLPSPVFDVGDERLLAPGDMPERIAALCRERGQAVPEGMLGTVRSIVESLATAYAESVRAFSRVTGARIRSVRIVGGGSRNEFLCRRTAELSGLTVVAGPAEASAFGNLAVQLVAAGEFASLDEVYAAAGSDGGEPALYEPSASAARAADEAATAPLGAAPTVRSARTHEGRLP